MRNLVPQRYPRRRLSAQTMLLASKSRGVQCLSESSVARLINATSFTELFACSCSRAAQTRRCKRHSTRGTGVSRRRPRPIWGKPESAESQAPRGFPYQFFRSGCERKFNPLPEKRVNQAEPLGQVGQKTAVIVDTSHQCSDLLHIRGHRHIDQRGNFFCVRA